MIGAVGDPAPIYVRLAELIADEILVGKYPDGGLVPSSNELAETFNINPATAARALNLLVQSNTLEVRRGVGTAVAQGGRDSIAEQRRQTFVARRIQPLLMEASALGISTAQVQHMLGDPSPESRSLEDLAFEFVVAMVATAI